MSSDMLSNNLFTPPNDYSSSANIDNESNLSVQSEDPSQPQYSTLPNHENMGFEGFEERSDMSSIPVSPYVSDEEMGQVDTYYITNHSHTQDLHTEMDALDAEIMGEENFVDINAEILYGYGYQHEDEEEDDDNDGPEVYHPYNHASQAMPTIEEQLPNFQEHEGLAQEIEEPHGVDEQPDLYRTLKQWGIEALSQRQRGPSLPVVKRLRIEKLISLKKCELRGERCDIQKINWVELGVKRSEARQYRSQIYKNYTNRGSAEPWHSHLHGTNLSNVEDYFSFRKMEFNHEILLSHFQLRNLIACPTRDHVFYAGRSRILHCNPTLSGRYEKPATVLNLTNFDMHPLQATSRGVQITTMAVGHNILVAGGFCGEYGLVNLRAENNKASHTEGCITDHHNSITNHVQVHSMRNSSLPVATFASNDTCVRILDISTNSIISEHPYDHAINCSAISPDCRLRVMVGDTCDVMICNSDTGEIYQSLEGHQDFGFACDWADDGWTVATGNQDMQVKIWDARKWTTNQGVACPIAHIPAEIAGVRKLKFSPLGSGKRVLVAAEAVDYISIIDAETFDRKQTLSFFGEVSGVDFTNDGQDLFIANSDRTRGGLMEFERSNLASHGLDCLEKHFVSSHRRRPEPFPGTYDWMSDEDMARHPKSRGTWEAGERRAASLGTTMGYF